MLSIEEFVWKVLLVYCEKMIMLLACSLSLSPKIPS
jgi:hypothetical protein